MTLNSVGEESALFDRPASGRRSLALLSLALAVGLIIVPASSATADAQEKRGFPQAAQANQAGGNNGGFYALVIGIDNYTGPLNQLKTAVHDAQAVADRLETSYGFQVQLLLDGNATRTNILNALNDRYRNSLSANDNFLIYYAGHGYYDRDADKAYWLPVDAESNRSANRISADDLTTAIRAYASRHVLIISDSCYSGDLSRGGDEPSVSKGQRAFLNRMQSAPSRTLLSSGSDEPVSDNGPDGHSIFAAALLYALQSQDDAIFTAADLAAPIQKMVRTRSDQIPRYFLIGNSIRNATTVEIGDFVFIRKSAPVAIPAPTSPSPVLSPAEMLNKAVELADAGDLANSFPLFSKACAGGSADGCDHVGWMYEHAAGVGKDVSQAVAFYRKACDGGFALGCSNLAIMFENGTGVGKDEAQAVRLAGKACDGGYAQSCTNLALIYGTGNGVGKDDSQAFTLLRKACDGGNAQGCNVLGYVYERGLGVGKDVARAVDLYRKACDAGWAGGCTNLGVMYENGVNVAKDHEQAVKLYRQGCEGNDQSGCDNLKRLQP